MAIALLCLSYRRFSPVADQLRVATWGIRTGIIEIIYSFSVSRYVLLFLDNHTP
jgi:hypothetical protein